MAKRKRTNGHTMIYEQHEQHYKQERDPTQNSRDVCTKCGFDYYYYYY